jgi:hypothetical protein
MSLSMTVGKGTSAYYLSYLSDARATLLLNQITGVYCPSATSLDALSRLGDCAILGLVIAISATVTS